MSNANADRSLAIAAGLVIVSLTGAAFWLSYAHLADVARAHGLEDAPARAWAWPATLDLFIVAGELMMLRAALAHRVDWWAVGLTVTGSGGSIALNVAGVGAAADPLDYVVAAVPPTAALLAFGALMRQIHQALAAPATAPENDTLAAVSALVREPSQGVARDVVEVSVPARPELEPVPASSQVICGVTRVWNLTVPPAEVSGEPELRLPSAAARTVIESAWKNGTPAAETARLATRSVTYVKKVFRDLDGERGATQVPGQLALVGGGDA